MSARFKVLGMVTMLLFGNLQPVAAQVRPNIVNVPSAAANCILRNKALYQEKANIERRRTISIYPTICPTTSPSSLQLSELTYNSGGKINPNSTTILIPVLNSGCFFDRLGRAMRLQSSSDLIAVDITSCGR
jgi:hypothetical protein